MRKSFIICLFILPLATLAGFSQGIVVSFNPSDNKASIDSIIVLNQSTRESFVVRNKNSVVLTVTSQNRVFGLESGIFTVTPNPFRGKAMIRLNLQSDEVASFTVVNSMGKVIAYLENETGAGLNSFELSLKSSGLYWITCRTGEIQNTIKILNLENGKGENSIIFLGPGNSAYREKSAALEPVQYQFDVFSGGNITRIVDKPQASKTYSVDFHECRDAAGRKYRVVQIGTQWWMAENLAYLPVVSAPAAESNIDPVYYVYGYNGSTLNEAKNSVNYKTYGVLYNWKAALAGCPEGWHLPSDAEYSVLSGFLGGSAVDGGKLKEAGTLHWGAPNSGATNESGFSALPGGCRSMNSAFSDTGSSGFWWNSTEFPYEPYFSKSVKMNYGSSTLHRESNRSRLGFSVRCIKN